MGREEWRARKTRSLIGQTGGANAHVALIEQRELQDAAIDQTPDGGAAKRRDPVEISGLDLLLEASLGDHAAVADEHHPVQAEAVFDLGDLSGERGRIAGGAFEHLHRHRAAVGGAEQAIDDLQLPLLAVPAVAELAQGAAAPLQVAGGDVVKHQDAILEMTLGQGLLDGGLTLEQPIEGPIELLPLHAAQPQQRADTGGLGARASIECSAPNDSRSKRTHSAADRKRTGASSARTMIDPKPAASYAASRTPGAPRLNGPGKPGAGAGRPAIRRMMETGIEKKPFFCGVE